MDKTDFEIEKLGPCTIDTPLDSGTHFENDEEQVLFNRHPADVIAEYKATGSMLAFEKAGPRAKIFHDPSWSKAAILTAGGLCPGLNNVIKSLTLTLKSHYNVPVVYGIRYGYRGLTPKSGFNPIILNEDNVDEIHMQGGTILGSSRGDQDIQSMVETLVRMDINMLFCIGGDGTLRCAHKIATEIKKRQLCISVIGVPKTIDNDISFMDRTFGFQTAVDITSRIINPAHNEAKGAYNGVSLVHVMGRDSGFIAAYSTLANSHVNYCLVPEEKFSLRDGPNAFLPSLEQRLERRHHAVVVVAEGAGQEFFEGQETKRDSSGNVLHNNIGLYLKDQIAAYAKERKFEYSMKYFEPAYVIRSVAAEGTDAVFCLMLAQNAVHAAMAGRSDMVVGHWSDSFTHVPIALATSSRKRIDPAGTLWRSVRLSTWPSYD